MNRIENNALNFNDFILSFTNDININKIFYLKNNHMQRVKLIFAHKNMNTLSLDDPDFEIQMNPDWFIY